MSTRTLKAKKAVERELPVRNHAAAVEKHDRLGDQRQEGEQRDVERPLPVGVDRTPEDALGLLAELRGLVLLLGERLDDVDADDVLLGHGGDVGELLLHVAEDRVRDLRVAVGDEDEERA